MIRRVVLPDEKTEVVSADLTRALAARGSAADPELRPRDEIMVFDLSASRDRILEPVLRTLELQATPDQPEQIVSIDGRVKAPGRYPLEPTMHVSDLMRAGGSLEDSAYRGDAELTRYEVVNGLARKTDLIPVNLAAIRRGETGADLALRPYDVLVIKPIVQWHEPGEHRTHSARYASRANTRFIRARLCIPCCTRRRPDRRRLSVRRGVRPRRIEEAGKGSARAFGQPIAERSGRTVPRSRRRRQRRCQWGRRPRALLKVSRSVPPCSQQLRNTKPVGRLVIDVERVLKGIRTYPAMCWSKTAISCGTEENARNHDPGRSAKPHLACIPAWIDSR